jgi:hypothetical protein
MREKAETQAAIRGIFPQKRRFLGVDLAFKTMNLETFSLIWEKPRVRRTLYLLAPAALLSAWACPFFGLAQENVVIALCGLNCLLASLQLRSWGVTYLGFEELDYGQPGELIWRGSANYTDWSQWERGRALKARRFGGRKGLWHQGGDPRWN